METKSKICILLSSTYYIANLKFCLHLQTKVSHQVAFLKKCDIWGILQRLNAAGIIYRFGRKNYAKKRCLMFISLQTKIHPDNFIQLEMNWGQWQNKMMCHYLQIPMDFFWLIKNQLKLWMAYLKNFKWIIKGFDLISLLKVNKMKKKSIFWRPDIP